MIIHTQRNFKKSSGKQKSKVRNRYRLAGRYVAENKKFKTHAESKLYDELKKIGVVFVFQKDIHAHGTFKIADFYFNRGDLSPLIVEVDGLYHVTEEQILLDEKRTKFLKSVTNCELLRFSNKEVENNLNSVVDLIKSKHVFIQHQT